ncbi:Cathepsin L-like proteinase [Echinococcus granulosus]|uniref:Cathepsin L n=1 Tax=Echinococcus granulosus TaxID=6210 RepID=A0A068WA77_ECHGR|nr:Cathepsin L-like proteinase [Echinococcus granulosus]CDS16962.1 cathepsin L [Echinococcus granulosus]
MPRWLHLCLLLLTLTTALVSLIFLLIVFERIKNLNENASDSAVIISTDEDWLKWTREINISFESEAEANYRHSVWRKNYNMILAHNARKDSLYTMGTNHFTHLEHWEFVEMYLRSKKIELDNYDLDSYFEGNKTIRVNESIIEGDCYLGNFDWRERFPDRKVRDQMSCGSCWAFASVSAVEWHWAIHHGRSLPLSVQQLVDCVQSNFGCNGGIIENALAYIQSHGIMLNRDYPYRSRVTQCTESPDKVALKIKGYETLYGVSEAVLACIVQRLGPVVIGFDASGSGLQHYKSGIYDGTDCNVEMLNHGLVLLGFGTDARGNRYWICQNSFSQRWGDKGFFRFKFGNNLCGVAATPIIPVV